MAGSPEPHSGDDTYDLIDDAVTALADRRGTWLGDDIAAIALIASLIDQAERWLPQRAHDARANGHSWEQIARALATSPAEARLRFDPESPAADGRCPTTPDPPAGGATSSRHHDHEPAPSGARSSRHGGAK
jgi:hypothetical protein